jgi:hypothetical protein
MLIQQISVVDLSDVVDWFKHQFSQYHLWLGEILRNEQYSFFICSLLIYYL